MPKTNLTIVNWDGEVPDGCEPVLELRTPKDGDIYLSPLRPLETLKASHDWPETDTHQQLCFRRKPVEMHKYCPYCGEVADNLYWLCPDCCAELGQAGYNINKLPPMVAQESPPAALLPKPWVKAREYPDGSVWRRPGGWLVQVVRKAACGDFVLRCEDGAEFVLHRTFLDTCKPWTPQAGEMVYHKWDTGCTCGALPSNLLPACFATAQEPVEPVQAMPAEPTLSELAARLAKVEAMLAAREAMLEQIIPAPYPSIPTTQNWSSGDENREAKP